MMDLASFFEGVEVRIRGFAFIAIAAVGGVQDIVDNLKRETDAVAIESNSFQIRFRSSTKVSADPDTGADQSAGIGPMTGFELGCACWSDIRFKVEHLTRVNHTGSA